MKSQVSKSLFLLVIVQFVFVVYKLICWYIPDRFCVDDKTGDVVTGILSLAVLVIVVRANAKS